MPTVQEMGAVGDSGSGKATLIKMIASFFYMRTETIYLGTKTKN